jgi:hypothetical protein
MSKQYPRELRERGTPGDRVSRRVETEYAAIGSIAAKLCIARPELLRKWVR